MCMHVVPVCLPLLLPMILPDTPAAQIFGAASDRAAGSIARDILATAVCVFDRRDGMSARDATHALLTKRRLLY